MENKEVSETAKEDQAQTTAPEENLVAFVDAVFEKHLVGSSGATGGWKTYLHQDAYNLTGEFNEKQIRYLINRALNTLMAFKPAKTFQLRLALQRDITQEHWKNVVDAVVSNLISVDIVRAGGVINTTIED